MITYILETIVFQIVFLLVYDHFLKKETFFQWNRVYLFLTFLLSLILPLIEIEAFKSLISSEAPIYPEFLWKINSLEFVNQPNGGRLSWSLLGPVSWILVSGMVLTMVLFGAKLYRIQRLRREGVVTYHSDFTKVLVRQSSVAFSFFKQVFVGENISEQKVPHILSHEMVHVKQWHSVDLIFFELMRIVFWFNPMLYVYQKRMAELHEFIADAITAKDNSKAQYQLLLSEIFQTKRISFINQFFKESLIKKRIVMLTKEKSSQVSLIKYFALVPLVFIILIYTSCESDIKKAVGPESTELNTTVESEMIPFMTVQEAPVFPGCESSEDTRGCFIDKIQNHVRKHFNYPKEAQDGGIQGRVAVMFTIDKTGTIANIQTRGPHAFLENEVERIIKRLPKMQPGKHKGDLVEVPFSLPVVFKLD